MLVWSTITANQLATIAIDIDMPRCMFDDAPLPALCLDASQCLLSSHGYGIGLVTTRHFSLPPIWGDAETQTAKARKSSAAGTKGSGGHIGIPP